MSEQYQYITYEKTGRIVRVTINRPEVRNALNLEAHLEMDRAWRAYAADEEAWVAIVTGSGDRAFCAGADLKRAASGESGGTTSSGAQKPYWMTFKPGGFGGLTERWDLAKPVIAAVNGYALGGGFEIVMSCDVVVAAEHAKFGLPEPRVGFTASDGGIHRIVRQLPLKVAMGMLVTGRQITADEAHRWGVVNEVVPADKLMEAANAWAESILECAPLSVWASKQAAMNGLDLPLPDAINRRYEYMLRQNGSEDSVEGPRAFGEKRKPVWKGR